GDRRQRHRLRAWGEQQVLATDPQGVLAGAGRDLRRLAIDDAGPAADDMHAVFLQQRGDTCREPGDDAVLPPHRLRELDARRLDADAKRRLQRVIGDLLELLGGVDQRLRRNAADVEAGAAEFVAFDERGGGCAAGGGGARGTYSGGGRT